MYQEEEMLMLSGIQHFAYCPRQWALIHIDSCWKENVLTTQGALLHKHVDTPKVRHCFNGVATLHHVAIASRTLGLYGITDAVELITPACMCAQHARSPLKGMIPYPVEYKRGHSKSNLCDILQLTAQAICLEEMFEVDVGKGALFYWKTRRREEIIITPELRNETQRAANCMHEIFRKGELPPRMPHKGCTSCSLYDECQPTLANKCSVKKYLEDQLYAKDA